MLAVCASEEDAQCFVLRGEREVPADRALGIEEVIDIAGKTTSAEELIGPLADLWCEKSSRRAPSADPRKQGKP